MITYTLEEQAKNREAWIEALRSGEYEQWQHQLRVKNYFCCLGVACDISRLGKWSLTGCYEVDEKNSQIGPGDFSSSRVRLPTLVMNWLGLRSNTGEFKDDSLTIFDSLINRNDEDATFDDIADIIEGEPPGLIVTR